MAIKPLAERMRPRCIDEIIGQQHILAKDKLLYRMIENDMLSSIILYGPPGTGKTSIAYVIAQTTKSDFHKINAVQAGKKEIADVCEIGKKNMAENKSTILFIDEIHRFNKAQQDYLLPFVEYGTVILIGATTENPFFEVNPALISRSTIFELQPTSEDDIKRLICRALTDKERGLGNMSLNITEDALTALSDQSNGDVRFALSTLELASLNCSNGNITVDDILSVIQKPHLKYDKDGDMHYDTISAFIKSMRGSDPNATLYYLARMIEAGEDPKFIARRIMVHAAEDVGLADPNALNVATSAALAVERVGFPEGRIILAEAALYIALAPKSNSCCEGIDHALHYVKQHPSNDVPSAMRDCHYKSASKLGHGIGYMYPHDYSNHWVPQQYLPDSVVGQQFYHSDYMGYQQNLDNYQKAIRNTR